MDREARRALEAILFVVDEPVDVATLSQILEVGREQVEALLAELAQRYIDEERGFVLREVAGGWRLYTAPEVAPYVERFVLAGRSGRLTQAALETLAVVAYKQPISRHDVGEIRGVNADGAIRTLVQRGLVEEVGRDDGPGQAILYGTTVSFLEKLGLRSLDDLPELADHLPEAPAPDEPAPADLRAARKRIAAGEDLPSTGRPRWSAGADEEEEDAQEVDLDDTEVDGAPGTEGGARDRIGERRRQESEMADLTAALERAASAAVSQLREAMQAAEDDADGAREEAGPDAEGAGGAPEEGSA